MSWRDLIARDEWLTLPWVGGRKLRLGARSWDIDAVLPIEHGWYQFLVSSGRSAVCKCDTKADAEVTNLTNIVKGYLVGDHLVADTTPNVDPNPLTITKYSERVHLIEEGLDRFVRISAGRTHENGPLIYNSQEMPLGSEEGVLNAFLDNLSTVNNVKGVSPALDAAFRMEVWQRAEIERLRIEAEKLRLEEEAKRVAEERRKQIVERLGDAVGRREMAKLDFGEAARAALTVGGAEFLDYRKTGRKNEWAVRYRLNGMRLECVCDERLAILDSGICLQDHNTGIRGDKLLSLESLPSVIREAERKNKLVIYRHG